MSAATTMAGLFAGLFIGAPVGFTYAVARRAFADRVKGKAQVKQHGRDGWAATRAMMAWVGGGVVVVVVVVAAALGATGPGRATPDACASASAPISASISASASRPDPKAVARPGPAGRNLAGRTPEGHTSAGPGRLTAADPPPSPCR